MVTFAESIEPLTPAYGRDYKSLYELQKAWREGKDFKTASGQYTTRAELAKEGITGKIMVRYNKNRRISLLSIESEA